MTTSRPMTARLAGLALASLAALASTSACGPDQRGAEPATVAAAGSGSVTEFAGLFASYGADYEHVASPAKLAARSALVVQGRIERFDPGRMFGTSAKDPVARHSVVMVVTVERVLRGRLAPGSAGKVYVELHAPRALSAADFNEVAPRSSAAVLYLGPAATAADTPLVTPDTGRPAGLPLYQPASPQGFVLQAGAKVVQVLEFTEFPDASIADFAPAAKVFPQGSHRG